MEFIIKKLIITGLIVSLLFYSCKKQEDDKIIIDDLDVKYDFLMDGDLYSHTGANPLVQDEEVYTIEDISHLLFSELKIEWVNKDLNEFLSVLIKDGIYTINERIIENYYQTREGTITVYEITSSDYLINMMYFSTIPDKYYLYSIQFDITNDNIGYFPYIRMSDYERDTEFGGLMEIFDNTICYEMRMMNRDAYMGYSDLIFSNGLLKSIRMRIFWP